MSSKPPVIKYSVLQAFFANLFVATNHLGQFVWDDQLVKRAVIKLMQRHDALRPYGPAFLGKQNVEDAPAGNQPPYIDLMRWFRGDCVDVVDPRRSLVKLNDACLQVANAGRDKLDAKALETIKSVGPEFFRSTQMAA